MDPLALTLVILSLAYPATLAMRFTSSRGRSSRAASALFVAASLSCAFALAPALLNHRDRRRMALAVAGLSVVLIGGTWSSVGRRGSGSRDRS